jgi:uncharacterized protein (TIGR02117 family)
MKRPLRILLKIFAGLVAIPALYLSAALLLGTFPANRGWHEAERGVPIFVMTNGVHTWLMVPAVNQDMDWRPLVPGEHLRDPRYGAADHVAFGYGNREFYLNTPTWSDLNPRTAFLALFGRGSSLVHADHEHRPEADEYQRPLTLSRAEYRRLVAFIRASFRYDANGRTMPLLGRGYGPNDIFYEAVGRYDAFRDCNQWTGEALRQAGVKMGVWTPFSQSVMWRIR